MKTIKINPADNVAVAIEPLRQGEQVTIDGQLITLSNDVPAGHKFLLTDLRQGQDVVKYGYPIGHLNEDHQAGDFVCDQHISTNLSGLLDYSYDPITIDETDEWLCQLVMDIQLACQDHFFGRYWDDYFAQNAMGSLAPQQKRRTNLVKKRYRMLPEAFDVYDLVNMFNLQKRNAEKIIERWLKDHYIERVETGLYRKLYLELT